MTNFGAIAVRNKLTLCCVIVASVLAFTASRPLFRGVRDKVEARTFIEQMNSKSLTCVLVKPKARHSASIIFSHGLGDSGLGWQSAAALLSERPSLQHIKWVLPNAPAQPVTLNMGMRMPSWYDIKSLDGISDPEGEDITGMQRSAQLIHQLVEEEVRSGVPTRRIVIGGFSQGSVISLLAGLTTSVPLAGVVVLSGYAPIHTRLLDVGRSRLLGNRRCDTGRDMRTDIGRGIPIFWGHGTSDQVIKYTYGEQSQRLLRSGGQDVEFHAYAGMPHSACEEELEHFADWLERILPQNEVHV